MYTVKPDNEFRAGTAIIAFKEKLDEIILLNAEVCLDLSEVTYMDTHSFRLVFDYLPKLKAVIPPRINHIIMMYDLWVDSKKGLEKKHPSSIVD